MKIAFWSNSRGQSGVTTNLAVMSILRALEGGSRSIILENHFNVNNLEGILLNRRNGESVVREGSEYIFQMGLEYIMKNVYSMCEKTELIKKAAIPVLDSSIWYLPQSNIINRQVFSYEFSQVMYQLFQCLEMVGDCIYIDTEMNENLSSRLILDEADLIVVNINQNFRVLEDFFKNHVGMKEKCVYLVGNYRENSACSIRFICDNFDVPRNRIGAIPYNMNMADAISDGRLIGFLSRNCYSPSEENEVFMRYAKEALHMIEYNMQKKQKA